MVNAVDARGGQVRKHPRKAAFRRERDFVEIALVRIARAMLHARADLRADVLKERAAERDVDELQPAADAEHGLARLDEFVEELDLVFVADAIAAPRGIERFFAVCCRTQVRAALQDETVEFA